MKKETIEKVLKITKKIETLQKELDRLKQNQKVTPITLMYNIWGIITKYVIINSNGDVESDKNWNKDSDSDNDTQYEYSDWMADQLQRLTRTLIEKYEFAINDLKKELEDLRDE